MCQLRILFPLHFVVFNQTVCHLAAETNVEQVFLRSEQLSELNLDPHTLDVHVFVSVQDVHYTRSPPTLLSFRFASCRLWRFCYETSRRQVLWRWSTVPDVWGDCVPDVLCLVLCRLRGKLCLQSNSSRTRYVECRSVTGTITSRR